MKHIAFGSDYSDIKAAILIKTSALNKPKIERYYVAPHTSIQPEEFIAFDLWYNEKNKCPAKPAKAYLDELMPEIDELGINLVMVCDANYFKFLTKNKKADPFYGYVCPCAIEGYEHINVVLSPNYQAMMYNPNLQDKMDLALKTVQEAVIGSYEEPGKDIIEYSYYPETVEEIINTLEGLHHFEELTCDIETKSLQFWLAGISTISFAWTKHRGVAFGVDRGPGDITPTYRPAAEREAIRAALFKFFNTFKGKLIWHNIGYDGKTLVYQLYMKHLADYPGMFQGIEVFNRAFDDTKLIAYLATNNAVQNRLSLKDLSAPFTGNYAQDDIKDTDKIPYAELLKYNLTDCLATWYVKEKYEPILIEDKQQVLYEGLIKDSVKTLMQTELCGMPIDPDKVQVAKGKLAVVVEDCDNFFKTSEIIEDFHYGELKRLAAEKTAKAKKKVYTVDDEIIYRNKFNPGSDTQVRKLIYDYLGYPVIDLTKGKQPSCQGKTIKKLMNRCTDPEHMKLFEYIRKRADASIILSTFIPAFENAQQLPDGSWRLYGNFNLGGTQSLRLSSSNPEQ